MHQLQVQLLAKKRRKDGLNFESWYLMLYFLIMNVCSRIASEVRPLQLGCFIGIVWYLYLDIWLLKKIFGLCTTIALEGVFKLFG